MLNGNNEINWPMDVDNFQCDLMDVLAFFSAFLRRQ